MKQAAFAMLAMAIIATSVGCHSLNRAGSNSGCSSCDSQTGCDAKGGEGGCSDGQCGVGDPKASFIAPNGKFLGRKKIAGPPQQGPPVGAVSYPYYRTRGPRDFLAGNPPSIGR